MNAGGAFAAVLAFAAVCSGCDVDAKSASQAEAAGAGGAGSGGAGVAGATVQGLAAEIPPGATIELPMNGGRVTNAELGIRGTVSAFADSHSALSLTSNLTPPVAASVVSACIAGTAAKVDLASEVCVTQEFTPPATDCFGEFSGVGVELSLNQPPDSDTGAANEEELSFDASSLQGFAFDLDGPTVPWPAVLQFSVVAADGGVFCNLPSAKPHAGSNALLFSQLVERCFRISEGPPNPTAESMQSKLVKLSWRVVTNSTSEVPFDFCISNVRAIWK